MGQFTPILVHICSYLPYFVAYLCIFTPIWGPNTLRAAQIRATLLALPFKFILERNEVPSILRTLRQLAEASDLCSTFAAYAHVRAEE